MPWDDDDDFDFNEEFSPEEREELNREMREEQAMRDNHPLAIQAEEVYHVVTTMLETVPNEERSIYEGPMLESCMIIPAKIAGAMGSGSWLLSMQNAAIIRQHAEYLLTSTSGLKYEENVDQRYVQLLREEMQKFRALFVEWVKEINAMKKEEDEFRDEWGLFLR
jgi:hypothetical protein